MFCGKDPPVEGWTFLIVFLLVNGMIVAMLAVTSRIERTFFREENEEYGEDESTTAAE